MGSINSFHNLPLHLLPQQSTSGDNDRVPVVQSGDSAPIKNQSIAWSIPNSSLTRTASSGSYLQQYLESKNSRGTENRKKPHNLEYK